MCHLTTCKPKYTSSFINLNFKPLRRCKYLLYTTTMDDMLNDGECAKTGILTIMITDCDRHRSKETVKASPKSSGVLVATRTVIWTQVDGFTRDDCIMEIV